MGVTAKQLNAALRSLGALGGQGWSLEQLAREADEAMLSSGVTTRQGAAAFVAQCMIESAYFRTTSEYGGSKARYAPYYGRGFIQVTFRDNYAKFGAWAKSKGLVSDANYFVNNPNQLASGKWKWLTAVWYLSTHRHDLIKLGNEGKIDAVGKGVHAGDAYASWYPNKSDTEQGRIQRNRFNHNRKAYDALLRAGITAPSPGSTSAVREYAKDDVKRFQRAHNLTDDGYWGKDTEKQAQAIRRVVKPGVKAGVWDRTRYWRLIYARPKGKRTAASLRAGIQWALGVDADGIWGPETDAAWLAIRQQHKMKGI